MTSSASSSRLTRSASAPSPRSVSRALSSPQSLLSIRTAANPGCFRRLVVSASALQNMSSDDDSIPPKRSLASLVQEIEPLDVSLIQKDVRRTTVDAVKRTISSMLGLLPSGRFQVSVKALWEPLSNLLVSSMMTGYTLHNAENRLCLERNWDLSKEDLEERKSSALDALEILSEGRDILSESGVDQWQSKSDKQLVEKSAENGIERLGELTPRAQDYIAHLESSLSSLKKELRHLKGRNADLHLRQLIGEKNELLNYLRSLEPEKVAELAEPASHEVRETVHSVVHGLLATLSPKMQSKAPPSDNTTGTLIWSEDFAELLENDTSLQFQPLIHLSRDYLARLLFWCMLLGHYIRGLEFRMELRLLSLSNDAGLEGDQTQ